MNKKPLQHQQRPEAMGFLANKSPSNLNLRNIDQVASVNLPSTTKQTTTPESPPMINIVSKPVTMAVKNQQHYGGSQGEPA